MTHIFKTHTCFIIVTLGALYCLASCKPVVSTGVIKDSNTGVVTRWSKVNPEKVILRMNGENIGHTDIPLGETVELIVQNVKGLYNKEGKILVGCELNITDASGKSLLQANDLFENNGQFEAVNDQYLKCIIYTGAPMQWDERYNIDVRFWDKLGEGQIESNFTVRMIDMP